MRLATWIALAAVVLSPIGFMMTHDRIVNRKIVRAFSDLDFLRREIKLSVDERHRLPSEAEGLASLAEGRARLLDKVPADPWLHPYVYRRIADPPGFVLYSPGADGADDHGAGDDITTPDKSYRCETYDDECAGSLPWWRNVGFAASFFGGIAWLMFAAVRSARHLRHMRRLRRA